MRQKTVGQSKPTGKKKPKRRHTTQKSTHSNNQESHKNTKQKAIIQTMGYLL